MNSIPLTPVRSSHLKAIGFDPKDGTLAVQFMDGGTYHYHGVGPQIHDQLMGASSKGKFFRATIKGHYRTRKVSSR